MRCTSCKSCSIACPFGTILPEFIPYISSRCDYCIGKSGQELPACQISCSHKAVELKDIEENPAKNIFFVGDVLAIHSVKWSKQDRTQVKK